MQMGKDNTTLPFEVTYAEMPGKESRTMKRLAVLVKAENVSDIISSLKELNLEATIYDVKGVTKDKERVASGRGSGTVELSYNSRKVIATVVNSSDVDEVVGRMKNLGGNKAVVMITSVDDLVLIWKIPICNWQDFCYPFIYAIQCILKFLTLGTLKRSWIQIKQEIPLKFAEINKKEVSVRLYLGNCVSGMKNHLLDKTIDVVVTSPPYNIGIKYNRYKDELPREEYLKFLSSVAAEIKRVLSDEGSFL